MVLISACSDNSNVVGFVGTDCGPSSASCASDSGAIFCETWESGDFHYWYVEHPELAAIESPGANGTCYQARLSSSDLISNFLGIAPGLIHYSDRETWWAEWWVSYAADFRWVGDLD